MTRKRKRKLGEVVFTQTITNTATGELYWFECSKDYVLKKDGIPGRVHGPFKTQAEVEQHQRITLLGPDCKVEEGGVWDPAREKPQ